MHFLNPQHEDYVSDLVRWKLPAKTSRFGSGVMLWTNHFHILRVSDAWFNHSHGSDLIIRIRESAGKEATDAWIRHVEEKRLTVIVSQHDVLQYEVRRLLPNARTVTFDYFCELIRTRAYMPWGFHATMHNTYGHTKPTYGASGSGGTSSGGVITVHGASGPTGASQHSTK